MKTAHSNLLYSSDNRIYLPGGSDIPTTKTFHHSVYTQKGYPFGKSIRGLKKFIQKIDNKTSYFISVGGSSHGGGYDDVFRSPIYKAHRRIAFSKLQDGEF